VYIWDVDVFTQQRISELRDEIAALQKENVTYAQKAFHMPSARHGHDLRRLRLEAIKDELVRMNKRRM
jgi:hypothetical protein